MHLVEALAAGVKGAENGTAEIYERGTTVRATYYLDFEGITYVATGLDVPLDSHGGAVVYMGELCTVIVKTSGGATLRSFVAGAAAPAVEVISPAFTGVDYVTASNDLSEPTTLQSVLDRWLLINGAPDWQVDIPGVGFYPIGGAIANSYGLVFNVKALGAKGDGVANDTNAINAAIAAANIAGGIVYFPPGNYCTTGDHLPSGGVSFMGAGPDASSILLDNASATVLFTLQAPAVAASQLFESLRIASTTHAAANMFVVQAAAAVVFRNVQLDATNFDLATFSFASSNVTVCKFETCQFAVSPLAPIIDSASTVRRVVMRDCVVVMPASFSPNRVIACNQLEAWGVSFRNNNVTSGMYSCIRATASTFNIVAVGCNFHGSGGATVTAFDLETYDNLAVFYESHNTFGAAVRAYDYTATLAARGAQIHLLTRESRAVFITDNSAAPVLPTQDYGLIVLSSTATAITFQALARPPDGARGTIIIYRPSGAAGTAIAGSNFLNPASIPTAALQANVWEYRVCTPLSTVRMALIVDGRSLGNAILMVQVKREPLNFGNAQASGHEELGGASPAAINVIVDATGAVHRRPGLTLRVRGGRPYVNSYSPIVALHSTATGRLFAVEQPVGEKAHIYELSELDVRDSSSDPESMVIGPERAIIAETEAMLVITAGGPPQKVLFSTPAQSSRLGGGPPDATHVIAHEARLLVNDSASRNMIRFSAQATGSSIAGHETWDDVLNSGFFLAGSRPDPVVALHENTNDVFGFGTTNVQNFVASESARFTFLPANAREFGCQAPYSVVKFDQNFAFIDGHRRVVVTDGRDYQIISADIQQTLDDISDLSDAFGYRVTLGPVDALCWGLPSDGRTFVYQAASKSWGIWQSWNDATNNFAPWPVYCSVRVPETGQMLVGVDSKNDPGYSPVGDVFALSNKVYKDATVASAEYEVFRKVVARVDTGFTDRGTSGRKLCRALRLTWRGNPSSDTAAFIQWRDDNGPWEHQRQVEIGYNSEVILRSLGVYRRRQWRVSFEGEAELVLVRAEEEFELLAV